ncbi:esrp2 [Symbiodinium sp. CCMP2592]|nr:esrp2 [Symbiodinium sp. CCMP2592]
MATESGPARAGVVSPLPAEAVGWGYISRTWHGTLSEPAAMAGLHVEAFNTCSDGACGLHAFLGHASLDGSVKLLGARDKMVEQLEMMWACGFQAEQWGRPLEGFETMLWHEFVLPGAGYSAEPACTEAKLFWALLPERAQAGAVDVIARSGPAPALPHPGFLSEVWHTYLACVQAPSHFFSDEELLWLAEWMQKGLLIYDLPVEAGMAVLVGMHWRDTAEHVLIVRRSGGRGHFERLLRQELAGEADSERDCTEDDEAMFSSSSSAGACEDRSGMADSERDTFIPFPEEPAQTQSCDCGVPSPSKDASCGTAASAEAAMVLAGTSHLAPGGIEDGACADDVRECSREEEWFETACGTANMASEFDFIADCAAKLSLRLKDQPTLPTVNGVEPETCINKYVWLPAYHCPFAGCDFVSEEREKLMQHLAGAASPHAPDLCVQWPAAWLAPSSLTLLSAAIARIERAGVPKVGGVTRRALRVTARSLRKVRSLICFVCGQIHVQAASLPTTAGGSGCTAIQLRPVAWFVLQEQRCPGVLMNSCGRQLYEARYGLEPMLGDEPLAWRDWCVRLPSSPGGDGRFWELLGATEDIECPGAHFASARSACSTLPLTLCWDCQLPVCHECCRVIQGSQSHQSWMGPPMAIANDHLYGFVHKILVEKHVSWLEAAACSPVWTGILVYYLESPYGDLVNERLSGPQSRTGSRGNLYSFEMPWESIEMQCADLSAELPHAETDLGRLMHIHVVGAGRESFPSLEGATLRADVLQELIACMRAAGFAGYTAACDSAELVAERVDRLYRCKYGDAAFVPDVILQSTVMTAARQANPKESLIWDKPATPAEPCTQLPKLEPTLRPLSFATEASGRGWNEAHEEYGRVLGRLGTLHVPLGSQLLDQFCAHYLPVAFPWTFRRPVGGFDVEGKPRWRRPGPAERVLFPEECAEADLERDPAPVSLWDLVRGLPRRSECQFRRHWNLIPGLFNLFFRHELNQGLSLSVYKPAARSIDGGQWEQSAAKAAADLYTKLQTGVYRSTTGQLRPSNHDFTKLRYAIGLSDQQRSLLKDFQFRTKTLPGTQEVRRSIGYVAYWANVVYGPGLFVTVTPGERQNYLAIRLMRARANDPHMQTDPKARRWMGCNMPDMQARAEDEFEVDVPGYDMRKLLMAQVWLQVEHDVGSEFKG